MPPASRIQRSIANREEALNLPELATNTLTQTNLHFKKLTLTEAIAYMVGTNVGAAVLALPYAARHTGYLGAALVCIIATFFSLLSHLCLTESMLRTPAVTQLVGLFRTYLFRGKGGTLYVAFLAVLTIGVAIPTLTAYVIGGAEALKAIFGLNLPLAQAIFFILGAAAVWLGLKTTGLGQKITAIAMGMALLILTAVSFFHAGADFARLANFDPGFVWPVFPVAVFTCLSQSVVPEVVRGLAHAPRLIPKAIKWSLLINLGFCLVVPLSIFALVPPAGMAEVATVSWGRALGSLGLIVANLFAFLALLTSFWGSAGAILTNVVDFLRLPSEWHLGYRLLAFAITIVPPVIIVIGRFLGFVQLVQTAGAIGGVILALVPLWVLRRARRHGERAPEYVTPRWLGWPLKSLMIAFYLGSLAVAALAL